MNKDWLDDVLKQDDRYLDDAGFTARVVSALPARRPRAWVRPVIIGVAAAVGVALALAVVPPVAQWWPLLLEYSVAWKFYGIPLVPAAVAAGFFCVTFAAVARER